MKKIIYIIAAIAALGMTSACSLDKYPLSQGSSETWYSNPEEMLISLNDMYRKAFWGYDTEYYLDRRTDDWAQRDQVYDLCNGSITAASYNGTSKTKYYSMWENSYKVISRAIRVLEAIEKNGGGSEYDAIKAEAYFFKGCFYASLTDLYGDVPYYDKTITIEESLKMRRTGTDTVRTKALEALDLAIEGLPEKNTAGGVTRVNKYVAKAIKARYCLYWAYDKTTKQWDAKMLRIAQALCKEIMESGVYELYYSKTDAANSYGEFFEQKSYNCENIFVIANAYEYEQYQEIKSWVLRTAGGTAVAQPSWDLLAAYECTDGKIITESPLFDRKDPYKNRDPRCNMTFCAPGTFVYDMEFNPDITAEQVTDSKQGKLVDNKDNKTAANPYAAYNCCCLRKGSQPEWRDPIYNENPEIIVRYADILLMYAECGIELGEIDNEVLSCINKIRARAYGVTFDEFKSPKYPVVTTTSQKELRKIMRRERRVELAWEGRRWYDLRRWGLLEQCYTVHYYGHLNASNLKAMLTKDPNKWFWPQTPKLVTGIITDEKDRKVNYDNIDCEFWDFRAMFDAKEIMKYGHHVYDPKVELFPIPEEEVKCNPKLGQNPGY